VHLFESRGGESGKKEQKVKKKGIFERGEEQDRWRKGNRSLLRGGGGSVKSILLLKRGEPPAWEKERGSTKEIGAYRESLRKRKGNKQGRKRGKGSPSGLE